MSTALDPNPRPARRRIRVGAVLMLLLAALAIAVVVTGMAPRGSTTTVAVTEPDPIVELGTTPELYVHVLGRVTEPGLYVLGDGSRVVDAVAAAGGFATGADQGAVNLARLLSDGEQLYVPAEGEQSPVIAGTGAASGPVNLNTADAAALDSLPRIGPALAARILAWRESNGRFEAVEDLLAVSGIGQSTFDGLRDLVTV